MVKPRIALLINLVAPSRVGVYERLAAAWDLTILHGGMESDRGSWEEVTVESACVRRVSGWQLSMNKYEDGKVVDHWFLHLEPGYITELLRDRPDAVVTDEMGFRTVVALAYGMLFRKPVWVWWGGTKRTESNVGWLRKLLRATIAFCARRWISYGRTSTEYLLSVGVPRGRILQVQNCVDESWYDSSTAPALEVTPRPVLLHVGRMVPGKGIAEFLRAAAQLQREGMTFSIVLVGEGSDSATLQRLACNLRLKNIHFYPAQPPKSMPGIYRSGDVLIFPTLKDVWGLVANEAVLSSLPVLCSQHSGCAQELFPPDCIFDPSDEKQFVAALRRAVNRELPVGDKSRLWSSEEVGDVIAHAVLASCHSKTTRQPRMKRNAVPQSATKH